MKNEYLGINLAKYIQNLYSENNKILVKVKDLNKWEGKPYSWITQVNIILLLILHNKTCIFNIISIKIPASRSRQVNCKFSALMYNLG